MSEHDKDLDPRRREFVLAALASGLFGLPGTSVATGNIHRLRGQVSVNGAPVTAAASIAAGDLVETGSDGQVIFSVADDAFILRRNSRVQLDPPPDNSVIVEGLRVFTGALLSVFASRRHRLATPSATIGIRGTGVYVEIEPDHDYVCTCYGVTELAANDDPQSVATIESGHHTARYVLRQAAAGQRIREAPFKNHSDQELTLIESLVGRAPAFGGDYNDYARPRRRSY